MPLTSPMTNNKLDPFCVENNLSSWASGRVILRGRDYYRKGHVVSVDFFDGNRIEAKVLGSAEEPYRVTIFFSEGGYPKATCECPFDWELLCKHGVAALLAWQQAETGSDPTLAGTAPTSPLAVKSPEERARYLEELAAIERHEREARAKEQHMRISRSPKTGLMGTYVVSSATPERGRDSYQVTLRDENYFHATCGCVDFRTNELGTCKHIERLKRRFHSARHKMKLERAEARSRTAFVYLGPAQQETGALDGHFHQIRIIIPPLLKDRFQPLAKELFDENGFLKFHGNLKALTLAFDVFVERTGAFLKRLGHQLEVEPEVIALFKEGEEKMRWEKRLERIAKNPEKDAAFRKTLASLHIKLHPYQTEGILFAAKKRRAFIGDDMGLGKTVQAIGTAVFLKNLGQIKQALVICPASLKFQWQSEIEKISGEKAFVMAGPARERDLHYKKVDSFFILINYELLHRDIDRVLAMRPDLVILDEAQRIKNWETKTAQTIKRLESPFRLVLTGTPLENRLAELQSISEFIDPGALGAPWKLVPSYAQIDQEDRIVGYTGLDRLRARLGRFLIRRTRGEVLRQLPERTDNNFWTSLTQDQKETENELARMAVKCIRKWERFHRLTREDLQRLLMLLNMMRIVCNAYGQYDWKTIGKEVLAAKRMTPLLKKKIGSPKLEEFLKITEDLLETPGQKIVVFSQWERMIRLAELTVRETVQSKGGESLLFSGALSAVQKNDVIHRFLEDPRARILFSTDAGSVGLNLQHACNCVINLEMPWNPAVLEQRIGRVHRMGQKKSVQVINLISINSIEERIYGLIANKKALFAGVLTGDTNEVNFDRDKENSFMAKMKQIVPTEEVDDEKDDNTQDPGDIDEKWEIENTDDAEPSAVQTPIQSEEPSVVKEAEDSVLTASTGQTREEGSHGDNGHKVMNNQQTNTDTKPLNTGSPGGLREVTIDLAPALSLLTGTPAAQTGSTRIALQLREDETGLHISLPAPAMTFLKTLRPLMDAFLKKDLDPVK